MTNRIVVDIGNSRISCGVFLNGKLVDLSHHLIRNVEKAAEDIMRDADAMKASQIAVCSVAPSASRSLIELLGARNQEVFQISAETQTIIFGAYESLGADRLANLVAGLRLFGKTHPVIVIDLGSATTLTAVSEKGKFLGGLITLGLGNTLNALHQATEQLPLLAVHEVLQPVSLAFDTPTAISSGCILGHTGLIQHWIKTAKQELGSKLTVVATGGYAHTIAPFAKSLDYIEPNLTIYGINFIAEAARDLKDPA